MDLHLYEARAQRRGRHRPRWSDSRGLVLDDLQQRGDGCIVQPDAVDPRQTPSPPTPAVDPRALALQAERSLQLPTPRFTSIPPDRQL